MDADPVDIVTCAKFDVDPFRGLDFGGGQNLLLAIGKRYGPYNTAVTTVLHVICYEIRIRPKYAMATSYFNMNYAIFFQS